MYNSDATKRLVRFINLMREHGEIEYFLCREEDSIKKSRFIELAKLMAKNGFHEIVYLMLLKYDGEIDVSNVKEDIFLENMADRIKRDGADGFCRDVITKMERLR